LEQSKNNLINFLKKSNNFYKNVYVYLFPNDNIFNFLKIFICQFSINFLKIKYYSRFISNQTRDKLDTCRGFINEKKSQKEKIYRMREEIKKRKSIIRNLIKKDKHKLVDVSLKFFNYVYFSGIENQDLDIIDVDDISDDRLLKILSPLWGMKYIEKGDVFVIIFRRTLENRQGFYTEEWKPIKDGSKRDYYVCGMDLEKQSSNKNNYQKYIDDVLKFGIEHHNIYEIIDYQNEIDFKFINNLDYVFEGLDL